MTDNMSVERTEPGNIWAEFDHPSDSIAIAEHVLGKMMLDGYDVDLPGCPDSVLVGLGSVMAANYLHIGDVDKADDLMGVLPLRAMPGPYLAAIDTANEAVLDDLTGLEDRLIDNPRVQFNLLCNLIAKGENPSSNLEKAKILLRGNITPNTHNLIPLLSALEIQGDYFQASLLVEELDTPGIEVLRSVYDIIPGNPGKKPSRWDMRRAHKQLADVLKHDTEVLRSYHRSYRFHQQVIETAENRPPFAILGLRTLARMGHEKSRRLISEGDPSSFAWYLPDEMQLWAIPDDGSDYQLYQPYRQKAVETSGRYFTGVFDEPGLQVLSQLVREGVYFRDVNLIETIKSKLHHNHSQAIRPDRDEFYNTMQKYMGQEPELLDPTTWVYETRSVVGQLAAFYHTLGSSMLEFGYPDEAPTVLDAKISDIKGSINTLNVAYSARANAINPQGQEGVGQPSAEAHWQALDLLNSTMPEIEALRKSISQINNPVAEFDLLINLARVVKAHEIGQDKWLLGNLLRDALEPMTVCEKRGIYPDYNREQAVQALLELGLREDQIPTVYLAPTKHKPGTDAFMAYARKRQEDFRRD